MEAVRKFHAQLTLLEQSIVNFYGPVRCCRKTDYFTKIGVHIEELESLRLHDDFILKIADKRDEVDKTFNGKKEMLIAQINKRTGNLEQMDFVSESVETKARSFKSTEEIFSFFAGDLWLKKIRNLRTGATTTRRCRALENLLNSLQTHF